MRNSRSLSRRVALPRFAVLALALGATLAACADRTATLEPPPAAPPPAEPGTVVDVTYCTGIEPVWVAFQDGDGAWTRALPEAAGARTTFRYRFTAERGGIATLTPLLDGALTSLSILYGAPGELSSAGDTNPIDCRSIETTTLFGRVAGLGASESAFVSAGRFSRAIVPFAASTDFLLRELPAGPLDLLATRTSLVGGAPVVDRLVLRRQLVLADSARIADLDFSAAESFAPATASVTIDGMGGEGVVSGTELHTSNSDVTLSFLTSAPAAPTRPYFALPADRLRPGDLQVLHVETAGPGDADRSADLFFRAPDDRHVRLGATLARPVVSAAATAPALRVRAHFEPQDDYDRSTTIVFEQASTSGLVSVAMTPAYAARSGGYDLVVPDLSAVPGFDLTWALRSGARLLWSATRFGGTLGPGRDAVPGDGATRLGAFLRDSITLR